MYVLIIKFLNRHGSLIATSSLLLEPFLSPQGHTQEMDAVRTTGSPHESA
jgi:hypothetical protein